MKSLLIHPSASRETNRAADYYDAQKAGLGREYVAEVRRIFDEIQKQPEMSPRYRDTEFRFHLAHRFPYVVYFLELDDAIWVMAVAHGRRRPGYWRRRRVK